MTGDSHASAAIVATEAGPAFVGRRLSAQLPAASATWGTAISRFGPFEALAVGEVLADVARPDLALHGLVETLPLGGRLRLTLPNVAFADRVLDLLDGRWSDTAVRRYFTRETAAALAETCGLTVHEVEEHPGVAQDPSRTTAVLGGRADLVTAFTLHCERTHRGTIPPPTTFAPAVDYTSLFQRGDGTCHSREIALLDGCHRVVEIAPASDMTHWLSDLGHRVTVVDRAVPSASRRWAERVVVGDLDHDRWWSGLESSADAVLLGNVIEHVADPVTVLRDAARCLDASASKRRVVVSVPNVAHADVRIAVASGRWNYRDTGILDRTHLHFFTAARLTAAATEAGLDVIEQRVTRLPRGASVNVVPWDLDVDDATQSPAPTSVLDIVDSDPDADVHVLTWALRPR